MTVASAHPDPAASPAWRSLLFVPADNARYVARVPRAGADAVVLDLEDGVAATAKEAARAGVAAAAAACAPHADVLVRINRPLRLAVRDIEAAVCPSVRALMLPKVQSASQVRLLAEVVAAVEVDRSMPPGSTGLYVVVEDVQALARMPAIAAAHPRVVAFTCGTEDLAASMGALPEADVLQWPKQQGLIAARSAGVLPLGVFDSAAEFRDLDRYRRAAIQARRFGIMGSTCIHPSQVAVLNEVFTPTTAELVAARAVLQAFDRAGRDGRGVFAYQGAMVDEAVVRRARQVLATAARLAARATPD